MGNGWTSEFGLRNTTAAEAGGYLQTVRDAGIAGGTHHGLLDLVVDGHHTGTGRAGRQNKINK